MSRGKVGKQEKLVGQGEMVGAWIVVEMYGNLTNQGRMFLGTTGNAGRGVYRKF